MVNVVLDIMDAWHELLDGNISVPVYRVDAPSSETGNRVLLRQESETFTWNKGGFFKNPVIIVEIVTVHDTIIDDRQVDEIDSEIYGLLFNDPGSNNLNLAPLLCKVDPGQATYIPEDNGVYRIFRKITRFTHYTNQ